MKRKFGTVSKTNIHDIAYAITQKHYMNIPYSIHSHQRVKKEQSMFYWNVKKGYNYLF